MPGGAAVKLPERLSLEEAATIPIAFLTAATALEYTGRMQQGDRVLIHSAGGGVGQAAVQLAGDAGAEIFATASVGKHDALRKMGIEHVYDSRRPGFAEPILEATSGAGVDLVLNSLTEEFLPENLRAPRAGGYYLDIAKARSNGSAPLSTAPRSRSHRQTLDGVPTVP